MKSGGSRKEHVCRIYGLRLESCWPLPCSNGDGAELAGVEFTEAPEAFFSEASREVTRGPYGEDWFGYLRLPDGSDYLRWSGLFEFLVSSDGRSIACRSCAGASQEAFHTYLLGQVLSFSLIKHGIEPLHSTVVVVDGQAVSFLGDCGCGKSSLGAAFLQSGYKLLTDDLLVLQKEKGQFLAYPGPPRIKLFPEIARKLLGEQIGGTPMNNDTDKLVIPLDWKGHLAQRDPVPLNSIYMLAPPPECSDSHKIEIRRLSSRQSVIELVRNTFNTIVENPNRLRSQFEQAAQLADNVPVKLLSYPRVLSRLPAVRDAIKQDLANHVLN